MTDAKHTPADDRSFQTSLLRNVGGGIVLIVAVAGLFWLIGQFGGGAPAVSDLQAAPSPTVTTSPTPASSPSPEPTPSLSPTPPPSPTASPAATPSPSPTPSPAPAPSPARGDSGGEPNRAHAPATVSVQVLDGVHDDGGSAARAVADALRGEGYNVVAVNRAIRYEVTTVLWTPGFEAQARQVAAELGVTEVRQQPGNLSDQVQVHVVVGADRS